MGHVLGRAEGTHNHRRPVILARVMRTLIEFPGALRPRWVFR